MSATQARTQKRWVPLESATVSLSSFLVHLSNSCRSDPEILTGVAGRLGLDDSVARFVDVLGADEELLALVPSPVYAVILLMPEDYRLLPDRPFLEAKPDERIHVKQTIGHACGTMAILHSLFNVELPLRSHCEVARLREECRGKTPEEASIVLEDSEALEAAHKAFCMKGQTVAPDATDPVDYGYVALVEDTGRLLEYAGYKAGVIDHGPCENLLRDAIRVLRDYQKLYPGQDGFSLIALCRSED